MRSPRIETLNGLKFIRLRSKRLISFWDALGMADGSYTALGRAISYAFDLAADELDLEWLEWKLDALEEYVAAMRKHLDEVRGVHGKRERIKLLRSVRGREPAEAAAYLAKADELEKELER